MKKEFKLIGISLFFIILILSLVSASFKYSSESIVRTYSGGEKLKGYINISFDDEYTDSIFRSNYNQSGTSLISLLNNNGYENGKEFNCSTKNCASNYITKEEINTLSINSGEEKYIGIKINRNIAQLDKLSFKINSDVEPSCMPTLSIDVLGNESAKIQGNAYKDIPCGGSNSGCFDESIGDYDYAVLKENAFCEKIELPIGPAFRIGAEVTNGSGKLTMTLFDDKMESLGSCILPKHTKFKDKLSCIVNFSNSKPGEFHVCIQASDSKGNYTIESETKGEICGATGTGFSEYDADYDIFAQALQYSPSNMSIDDKVLDSLGLNLIEYINEYINNEYSNNCTEGCVIPFRVYSQNSQTLSINDINVDYKSGDTTLTNDKIYSIEKQKPKIDSSKLRLDLQEADIVLPIIPSTNELQLFLDDKPILSKTIKLNITPGFNFEIAPRLVPIGIDSEFFIITNQNITKVVWDFGDGKKEETSIGMSRHIYLEAGEYNLSVRVTNSKNIESSKSATIIAGNVNESLNKLINQSQTRISTLSKSIDSYEPWIKKEIMNVENISEYQIELDRIKEEIKNVTNESELSGYVSELSSMNLPINITYSSKGKLPLEIGFNLIDANYIIDLESGNCTTECENYDWIKIDEVNDYIIAWNSKKFDSDISYKTIAKYTQEGKVAIFTYTNINVKQKEPYSNAYMIIPMPLDSVVLKQDYKPIKIEGESDGFAIPINGDMSIEMLLPGEVTPMDLGAFASEDIKTIIEESHIEPSCKDNPDLEECKKRSGLWLYILLIAIFIVSYLILQEWYKKRYESYLFPNKDDLYNLLHYIHNSRAAGLSDANIIKELEKMKWKGEQITYAMKKIDGKRTGMWEIPLFRFFENRKVQREIDKRNQNSVVNRPINNINGGNARFFNGPR